MCDSDILDNDLMKDYAEGDPLAFEELFRRYERRVFHYFLRRTNGSEIRAAELYQELFLRLHRFRSYYDPARPFAPWFFRMAHSVLIDEYRKHQRLHEVFLTDEAAVSAQRDAETCLVDRSELSSLLSTVSSEQAEILIASKVEGEGYAEIGARLGKSLSAVKKSASRALCQLRLSTAEG